MKHRNAGKSFQILKVDFLGIIVVFMAPKQTKIHLKPERPGPYLWKPFA